MTQPQPGDFFVTKVHGWAGLLIRIGQWLNGDGFADYEHAGVYIGLGETVEAMPGGAIRDTTSLLEPEHTLWSTGWVVLTQSQRDLIVEAAEQKIGVPYSFADYFALALHRFGIRPAWVKRIVSSPDHMICSQLVDWCYDVAGVRLFSDDRLPGDVTPADLYNAIKTAGSVVHA